MGLMDKTAIIFTTDHGFLFGEHGGHFGKLVYMQDEGQEKLESLSPKGDAGWGHDPLYEEIVHIPLLMYVPGIKPGVYDKLTVAVDVMPTVMDMLDLPIPDHVEGSSLLPRMHDLSAPGREFVVSGRPFANPGARVRHVDHWLRWAKVHSVSTVTAGDWSLLYAPEAGKSELYNLATDPQQRHNVVNDREDVARDIHQYLRKFMADTNLSDQLKGPRQEFRG